MKRAARKLLNANKAKLNEAFEKWRRDTQQIKREELEAMN